MPAIKLSPPKILRRILPALILILTAFPAQAQVKNFGTPHIINYPKKVYGAAAQNWCITQAFNGLMYFGNSDGLLEFDGERWRLYAIPNMFMYRSVFVAVNGTIYVGLMNDFGMMVPDDRGRLSFRSIARQFPAIATSFNDIWRIFEGSEGIYFQSKNKIFIYSNGGLEVIMPEREFNFLYKVNQAFYTSERQIGLIRLNGTHVERVPGGDVFAGKNIESIIPYDDTRIIIGTAKNGLYLYDGTKAVPWATEASAFLSVNSIFCGTQINKKYFAFGTIRNGLLIIDRNGKPIQHINKDKGLQNNTILSVYPDLENNLWLGLDQGISYVEIYSPITYYSYGKSLPGTGYCSVKANGTIYAGTNQGLFRKKWTDYEDPLSQDDKFTPVDGTQGQVWSLEFIDNTLFCGHNSGTFVIRDDRADLISDIPGGWDYLQLKCNPGLIIEGTYSGISVFTKDNNQWKFSRAIQGFNESSRFFVEDPDGSIWIAHGGLGIFRIVTDKEMTKANQIRVYNESDGLPSKFRNSVFKVGKQVLFTTVAGVYRYNKPTDSFQPDPVFLNLLGKEPITELSEDQDKNIWYFKPGEVGVIRTGGGDVKTVEKRPFNPLKKIINQGYENVNVIDETNILIACEEGFAHYDPTFPVKYPENRQCRIRSVIGTGDSTVTFFGGIYRDKDGMPLENQDISRPIQIPFSHHNIRIDYALPLFDNPEDIVYSYILQGYDKSRSEWSTEGAKDYTGLWEGNYTFEVRAKNIYNVETTDAVIRFRILPPWYRSILAYFIFFLILVGITGFTVRLIIRKIRREKEDISNQHELDISKARQQHIAESLESDKRLALLEKEKLEAEVIHKNKQLANSISGLLKKNEFLIHLREEMEKIAEKTSNPAAGDRLKKILTSMDENLEADNDYDQFEDNFDAVHDNFLKTFKKKFPQLTPKDLRLCAYLRMNLSTKEIAPLLNISPRGVEISRYRLRKKMNLPHDANLIDFMLKF